MAIDPTTGLPEEESNGNNLQDLIKKTLNQRQIQEDVEGEEILSTDESSATMEQLEEFGEVPAGFNQQDLERRRASEQSGLNQAMNAAGRVIANTPATFIGNLASIADLEDYANTDAEVGNWLTNAMDEYKESVNEALPIHRRSPGKALDFGDSAWWWENGSSLVESIGAFVGTGFVTGGALSWVNGMAGLGKAGAGFAQLVNAVGLNQAESITSAAQVFKETKDFARKDYNRLKNDPKAQQDPELKALLDQGVDKYADTIAAQAAAHTVAVNRANIALNLTSAGMFVRTPAMTRQLTKEVTKRNTLKKAGMEALQEAAEEEINLVSEKAGNAKGRGESYGLGQALEDVATAEGLEAGLLGAVGGFGQTVGTAAVGNRKGGQFTQQKERYQAQQRAIEEIEKISKANNVKSLTDLFDTVAETKELRAREKELFKDKENLTAEETAELESIAKKKVGIQAYSSFESGTTGVLLDSFKRLANMSEEEAIQKGVHDGKTEPESPDYYKNKANKGIEHVKKLEKYYNETKGKYINARQVYRNRIDMDAVTEYMEHLNQRESDLKSDKQRILNTTRDEDMKGAEALTMIHDDAIKDIQSERNRTVQVLGKLAKEQRELTSKEGQQRAKDQIKKGAKQALDNLKKSTEEEIANAETPEEVVVAEEKAKEAASKMDEEGLSPEGEDSAPSNAASIDGVINEAKAKKEQEAVAEQPTVDTDTDVVEDLIDSASALYSDGKRSFEEDKKDFIEAISRRGAGGGAFLAATNPNEMLAIAKANPAYNKIAAYREKIMSAFKEVYGIQNAKKDEANKAGTEGVPTVTPNAETQNPAAEESSVADAGAAGDPGAFNLQAFQFELITNPETGQTTVDLGEDGEMIPHNADDFGIDWDFLNSGELTPGSTIHYEIDGAAINDSTNQRYSDFSKLDTAKLASDLPIVSVHYIDGDINNKSPENRKIVGQLMTVEEAGTKPGAGELRTLRAKAFEQYTFNTTSAEPIPTGFMSEVVKTRGGRITRTETQRAPHTVLKEGDNLNLAIAVSVNGETRLHVSPKDTELEGETIFQSGDLTPGAVYMLVKNAEGNLIPVRIQTKELSEQPERKEQVIDLIDRLINHFESLDPSQQTSAAFNKNNKYRAFTKEIQKLTSLNIFLGKRKTGETFIKEKIVDKNGKTKWRSINATLEAINKWLNNKKAHISIESINQGNYNQQISEEGRITVDITPQQYVHSASVQAKSPIGIAPDTVPKVTTTAAKPLSGDERAVTIKHKGEDVALIVNKDGTVTNAKTEKVLDSGNFGEAALINKAHLKSKLVSFKSVKDGTQTYAVTSDGRIINITPGGKGNGNGMDPNHANGKRILATLAEEEAKQKAQDAQAGEETVSKEALDKFAATGEIDKSILEAIADKFIAYKRGEKVNLTVNELNLYTIDSKGDKKIDKLIQERATKPASIEEVVKVYHHTSISPKNFNFENFQRESQVSQFGNGLNASTETNEFFTKRYGQPIEGEINNKDFVEIDANLSESQLYDYLISLGYKINTPQYNSGKYNANSAKEEYDGTEPAKEAPYIINLFNDFQQSNPEVKGVKVINHNIGGTEVAPFYVIYSAESFNKVNKEQIKTEPISDADYNSFINTGKTTDIILDNIAEKVATRTANLSSREQAIFSALTTEVEKRINKIAEDKSSMSSPDHDGDLGTISQPEGQEDVEKEKVSNILDGLKPKDPTLKNNLKGENAESDTALILRDPVDLRGIQITDFSVEEQAVLNNRNRTYKDIGDIISGLEFDLSADLPSESLRKQIETKLAIFNELNERAPFKVGNNTTETWNEAEELAWFKDRFPNVDISVVDSIREVVKDADPNTWGVFKAGAVYIAKNAGKGTTQHEAFHAVYRMMLTDSERAQLFEEAKVKFGPIKDSKMAALMEDHPSLSDEQLVSLYYEEEMADAFSEYIITNQVPKTLGDKIANFFKKMWQTIKSVFSSNVSMNEVFYRADNKFYSKKSKLKNLLRDSTPFKKESVAIDSDAAYQFEGATKLARVKALNFLALDVINQKRDGNPDYAGLSDIEMLGKLGKGSLKKGLISLYDGAFDIVLTDYQQETNKARKKKLEQLLFGIKNPSTNAIGQLTVLAIKDLKNHGIKINFSNNTLEETANTEEDSDNLDADLEGATTKLEGWQIDHISTSSKDFGSQRLKSFMRRIKALKTKGKNKGEAILDDLGYETFIDYHELHNTLERDMADSQTFEEMQSKLDTLSKQRPEYSQIIDELLDNPDIAAEFFGIFSRTHAKFITIRNSSYISSDGFKVNTSKLITSNRQDTSILILDEWRNNLESLSSKILTNGKIDKKKAQKQLDKLNDLFTDFKSQDELSESDLLKFAKIVAPLGMTMDLDALAKINTEKTVKQKGGGTKKFTAKENFAKFAGLVQGISKQIAKGENPFEAGEAKNLRDASRILASATTSLMQSSFRNVDNKQVYSHILSNYMSDTMAKLTGDNAEQFINEEYLSTEFYKYANSNPAAKLWLGEMLNENVRKQMEYVILDGLQPEFGNGKKYTKLSEAEREATVLNMFMERNGKLDEKYGYYPVSVLSDAPALPFIRMKKYSVLEIPKLLLQQALAEENRIKQVIAENEARVRGENTAIKNFHDRGTKFVMFDFLNDWTESTGMTVADNPKEAEAEIQKYLDKVVEEEQKRIKNFPKFNKLVNKEIAQNLNNTVEAFAYNHVYAQMQMITIFGGDPAFYKDNIDFQKRFKQIWSPGTKLMPGAKFKNKKGKIVRTVPPTYNATYLEDNEITSKHGEGIYKALIKAKTPENDAARISALYGYVPEGWTLKDKINKDGEVVKRNAFIKKGNTSFPYALVNETDAQTYITIDRYRDIEISLGRWTDKHEEMLPRLRKGIATKEDLDIVLQTKKPFMFGQINVNGQRVPMQHKNSELVLLPQLAKGSTKLEALLKAMEDSKIDSVLFGSAVKVGSSGLSTLNEAGQFVDREGSVVAPVIHSMDNKNYKLQQETPAHHVDDELLFGTQIRKLIFSDIMKGETYKLLGKTGQELFIEYQDLISENILENFDEVSRKLGDINNLQEILLSEIESRQLGEEMEKAFQIVEREVFDNKTKKLVTKKTFNLPLFEPSISRKAEELINAVYKNRVTKQKINGAALIQASSFGFTDDLNIIFGEDGNVEALEVKMPWWTKQYFPTNEDGSIDFKTIKKEAPELLELVGYRIPTEDKYSMPPLRVAGFLPPQSGGAIMLPAEITTLSGSDFDVDKLQVMLHAFTMKNGKPAKMKYLDSNSTTSSRVKNYIDADFPSLLKMLEGTEALTMLNKDIESLKEEPKKVLKKIKSLISNNETSEALQQAQIDLLKTIDNNLSDFLTKDTVKAIASYFEDNLSVERQNPRGARDNRLLDITRGILVDKKTTKALLDPGGFDNHKDNAKEIMEAKGKSIDASVDIYTPSGQAEVFNRNMAGKELTGIMAVQTATHAITQFLDSYGPQYVVSFIDNLGKRITGKGLTNSLIKDLDGEKNTKKISRSLASYLAAVVDNAKEPIASFLNLNTLTSTPTALAIRAGMDEKLVSFFMAQPILEELTSKYYNAGGNKKALNDLYSELEARLIKAGNISADEVAKIQDVESPSHDMSLKELKTWMENTRDFKDDAKAYPKDYFVGQLKVLTKFKELVEAGDLMRKTLKVLRSDGIGPGPALANTIEYKDELLDLQKSQHKLLKGTDRSFLTDIDNTKYRTVAAFNRVMTRSIENLKDKFIWDDPAFAEIRKVMTEAKGDSLTAKEIEFMNYNAMTFLMSRFGSFTPLVRDKQTVNKDGTVSIQDSPFAKNTLLGKDNVGKLLKSFKEKYPELKNNPFLKRLSVTEATANLNMDIVKFSNTTSITPEQKNQYTKAFFDLMYTDPARKEGESDADYTQRKIDYKRLGLGLIHYSFFSQGFVFGPGSFNHLIPIHFWENFTNKFYIDAKGNFSENTKNGDDVPVKYIDYIERLRLAAQSDSLLDNFLPQFVRNFPDSQNYLRRVTLDTKGDKSNVNTKIENEGFIFNNVKSGKNTVSFLEQQRQSKENGLIKSVIIKLDVQEVADSSLYSESKEGYVFPKFIVEGSGDNARAFMLRIGEDSGTNFESGTAVWEELDPMGIKNANIEYYPNEVKPESMHKGRVFTTEAVEDTQESTEAMETPTKTPDVGEPKSNTFDLNTLKTEAKKEQEGPDNAFDLGEFSGGGKPEQDDFPKTDC
jgi:hypothetical protein